MHHLELRIDGMPCGSCVARVPRALQSLPGMEDVNVDLTAGRASLSGDQLSPEVLRKTVQDATSFAFRI